MSFDAPETSRFVKDSKTVIVDYGVGNIGAVANMIRRVGGTALSTSDPDVIEGADRLILPGVGAFDRAMDHLVKSGVTEVLRECVLGRGTPLLGICVGMQVLGRGSEEGGAAGLGWLDAEVVRFDMPDSASHLRVPQMGWNELRSVREDPLMSDFVDEQCFLYFLHSYHMRCHKEDDVVAWSHYGYDLPALVRSGPVWGIQGHPEKSLRFGMSMFKRFLEEVRCAT